MKKEWANLVGSCQKHKPQQPHHVKVRPRGPPVWGRVDRGIHSTAYACMGWTEMKANEETDVLKTGLKRLKRCSRLLNKDNNTLWMSLNDSLLVPVTPSGSTPSSV